MADIDVKNTSSRSTQRSGASIAAAGSTQTGGPGTSQVNAGSPGP